MMRFATARYVARALAALSIAALVAASSSLLAQDGRRPRAPQSFSLCRSSRGYDGSDSECVRFERGCPSGFEHTLESHRRARRGAPADPFGDGMNAREHCAVTREQCRGLETRFVRELARLRRLPRGAEGERLMRRPEGGTTLTLRLDATTLSRHISEPAGQPMSELLETTAALCRGPTP